MRYNEEMILQSASGFAMPFEEQDGKDVAMTLGYGEQEHPTTGERFFHHGVDFAVDHYLLSAVASGTVSGIGSNDEHGIFQTIRYGKYEVTYAHLANVYAQFGERVKAGQMVGLSSDKLHISVKFDGEEINPMDFLTMLYGNVKAMRQARRSGMVDFGEMDEDLQLDGFRTRYDADKEEIEQLMLRFLPYYFDDLRQGEYVVPSHTEQSLRNIFSVSAVKNYFFERMPSMMNPLGIGRRAVPLASKVQNLLIGDFLNYLALRHGICLSTMDDGIKKKNVSSQ